MQTLNWLESHVGSIDNGIRRINRFHWFISIVEATAQVEGTTYWLVKSGESIVFSADSREAVDAFLYGMSLAYAGIPDPLYDQLVEATKNWIE